MKYPVQFKQFSEQDGGKIDEPSGISLWRSSSNEKEARKAYNAELTIFVCKYSCKHEFRTRSYKIRI